MIHACSDSSESREVVSINDYANATDDIWCMESKEALDKLVELAAKNAYDEMNELFISSGVTTLRKGQSVKVIDEGLSSFRVRTFGGQECWVTSNMLTKGDDSSREAPDHSTPTAPVEKQKETTGPAYNVTPGEEIIGQWQDSSDSWSYVILKNSGRYYEDTITQPGSDPIRHELKVVNSANGTKYIDMESDTGDYDVIAKDGSLREYDREGYIRTARRVQK
jgi:hypothetical protein